MEKSCEDLRLTKLNNQVADALSKATYWERYGQDCCILLSGVLAAPFGFLLVGHGSSLLFALGIIFLSCVHLMFITKGAHAASHGSLLPSPLANNIFGVIFTECMGGFTFVGGKQTHVKVHHPHTNIVGLGDSSTFRAPFLGRTAYMVVVPFLLPFVAPLLSLYTLWGQWALLFANALTVTAGGLSYIAAFKLVSGLSLAWSIACAFAVRALYYGPYIHVNIFQHIGLPMYSSCKRPPRLALMANGVLNLSRNPFLDTFFGHSLVNCHVEHHLFPKLSDTMCMKVKPFVQTYIKDKGLPYNEDSYLNRFKIFWNNYSVLMVNQPSITDFIGVQ